MDSKEKKWVGSYHRWSKEGTVRHRQSKEARILWSHHEETRELPGARDNARSNARCTQVRKTTHSLDGQHQDMDRTPCERVNQNDKRREINGESTSMVWLTLGSRTAKEQNSIVCRAGCMELSGIASIICSSIWRLSVRLSHCAAVTHRCGGFAAVGPAGRRYQLTAVQAAGARWQPCHSMVCSGKCGQCHVVSWRRKLNTDCSWFSALTTVFTFPECDDKCNFALDYRYMGVGLSAGGINLNRLPGLHLNKLKYWFL